MAGISIPPVAGQKNKLINSGFDVWQRNTSFAANGYTTDRWYANTGTGGSPAMTVSRQSFALGQTAVPNEPRFWCRFNQTALASATVPYFEQRVESGRTLAGQAATVSFWAKADAARTVTVNLIQSFGTTGSPSADVITVLGTASCTTSWQLFSFSIAVPSISGKTLGSDDNDHLHVQLAMPLNATFTIDISTVQLETGSVPTEFEKLLLDDVLRKCQRYYEKYTANSGAALYSDIDAGGAAYVRFWFKAQKRAIPTFIVTSGSYAGGSANVDSAYWWVTTGGTQAGIGDGYGFDAEL